MTSKILYKYRSLEQFQHFVDIILNNRLYAPSFDMLNDPMEGFYYSQHEQLKRVLSDKKEKIRLCSLSRVHDSMLMWSHYADSHRGVVIGVTVDDSRCIVEPIQYRGLPNIAQKNFNAEMARQVLSHKLEAWKYENEERVFVLDPKCEHIKVRVESVIVGSGKPKRGDLNFRDLERMIQRINPDIKVSKAKVAHFSNP